MYKKIVFKYLYSFQVKRLLLVFVRRQGIPLKARSCGGSRIFQVLGLQVPGCRFRVAQFD